MYNANELRNAKQIHDVILDNLNKVGLLFRVFYRAKSHDSIDRKINKEPQKYSVSGKKIQDLYGIRVVVYFSDDLVIAQRVIKRIYEYDHLSSSIDEIHVSDFSAVRCNLIFKLPQELSANSQILRENKLIDNTFEVQFRTILSEGWHEVDHDLRYKCLKEWDNYKNFDRALNGIYATLETADWSMLKLFDELSYQNYKNKEWSSMMRNKFRLRLGSELSDECRDIMSESDLGKRVLRVDRFDFLSEIIKLDINVPLNLDNILFLCNLIYFHDDAVSSITPNILSSAYDEASERLKLKI
jgi:ppGpp synthetase/RelA/SpoT-type nucleotidyltranferase